MDEFCNIMMYIEILGESVVAIEWLIIKGKCIDKY